MTAKLTNDYKLVYRYKSITTYQIDPLIDIISIIFDIEYLQKVLLESINKWQLINFNSVLVNMYNKDGRCI